MEPVSCLILFSILFFAFFHTSILSVLSILSTSSSVAQSSTLNSTLCVFKRVAKTARISTWANRLPGHALAPAENAMYAPLDGENMDVATSELSKDKSVVVSVGDDGRDVFILSKDL